MRLTIVALFVTAAASAASGAQESRFSFELATGPAMASPIFDHEVVYPPADVVGYSVQQHRRLSVDDGTMITGRISYRTGEAWTVVAELGRGSTSYLHRVNTVVLVGGASSQVEQRGPAKRSTFSLGAVRRSSLTRLPIDLEPQLSLGIQRLEVGNPAALCVPTISIVGSFCAPFERTYVVPNIGAGVAAVYALGRHFGVELRGQYDVGIASTKDAFYVDLPAQYDFAEAPKWQSVRTAYFSVGVRIVP
jgi:hypothetical protein